MKLEVAELKRLLVEKEHDLVKLRSDGSSKCRKCINYAQKSADDDIAGLCTRDKLEKRVVRKFEHLKADVDKQLEKVHEKYRQEIVILGDKHTDEVLSLKKIIEDLGLELKNVEANALKR
jgi:hypothetical protein